MGCRLLVARHRARTLPDPANTALMPYLPDLYAAFRLVSRLLSLLIAARVNSCVVHRGYGACRYKAMTATHHAISSRARNRQGLVVLKRARLSARQELCEGAPVSGDKDAGHQTR